MGNTIGYIRVSTKDQNLGMQEDAMKTANVDKVFSDAGVSGTLQSRPALDKALEYLREGDTLVVWRLDRLGRNTRHVLELLHTLEQRGVKFRSLTEGLDTSGAMGRAMITIISAFAQMERDTMVERTNAGLASARARGRVGGRPTSLTPKQHQMVRSVYDARTMTVKEIAEQFNVSEPTIYRSIASTRPVEAVAV